MVKKSVEGTGEDLANSDDAAKELALLRATSRVYAALLHNIGLSLGSGGASIRFAGGTQDPEPVRGMIPSLTAKTGADLVIVECATGAMIANAHLEARLRVFAQARNARLWLVVPFDVLPEARTLIVKVGGGWKAVPGHV